MTTRPLLKASNLTDRSEESRSERGLLLISCPSPEFLWICIHQLWSETPETHQNRSTEEQFCCFAPCLRSEDLAEMAECLGVTVTDAPIRKTNSRRQHATAVWCDLKWLKHLDIYWIYVKHLQLYRYTWIYLAHQDEQLNMNWVNSDDSDVWEQSWRNLKGKTTSVPEVATVLRSRMPMVVNVCTLRHIYIFTQV